MTTAAVHDHRNEEIEVLRAFAVVLVLLHHYPALLPGHLGLYPYVEGMWAGVDLFFCISGYVIARSLLPVLAGKTGRPFWTEVARFWIKRWYRIIPAAWLWIVALMALIGFSGLKGNSTFWYDTFAAMFQYANFHFYRCTVDASRHCASLQPYWSLSLEEQFYLVLPFAALAFRRWLWLPVLAIALVQMGLERHHWSGLAAFVRTDAIALGVLLAVWSRRASYARLQPSAIRHVPSGLVLVALIAAIATLADTYPFALSMGAIALLSALLVWLASYGEGYLLRPGLLRNVAVKIGARSFSIYLGQVVSFGLAQRIVGVLAPAGATDSVTRIVVTVVVGLVTLAVLVEASYRLVEVPWRQRGRIVADRLGQDPAAASLHGGKGALEATP